MSPDMYIVKCACGNGAMYYGSKDDLPKGWMRQTLGKKLICSKCVKKMQGVQ